MPSLQEVRTWTHRNARRSSSSWPGRSPAPRARLWSTARTELESTSLSDRPRAAQWLENLRRGGARTRQDPHTATTVVTQSVRTLAALFPDGDAHTPASWGRGEPATRATGSAHGLDDGTLLSPLVLRGIALAHDTAFPTDAAARRALRRTAPTGGTWQEAALRERADHHRETHLTLRDLRTLRLMMPPGTRVHVRRRGRRTAGVLMWLAQALTGGRSPGAWR